MSAKALLSASVSAPPAVYVEDVFSTWLYTGNGSTQTITNGIDLSGEGGLVWLKGRSASNNHMLVDTARGDGNYLSSNLTNASAYNPLIFGSNGFGLSSSSLLNADFATYASWTFRKAPKFFDVVTYTGTGANRTIAHNLGSVPGAIWVKRTDTTGDWQCYHRSLANTQYMVLDSTAAVATGATRWNSATPTSSVFSLGTEATVNASGGTYVAYLFAHDAGGFGDSGDESVVSCGSVTTDGSGKIPTVNLGWEPQWLLIKRSSEISDWDMQDTQRGWIDASSDQAVRLRANTDQAETIFANTPAVLTSTGLKAHPTLNYGAGVTFIYIAIRRGPMKTPESGTEVFSALTATVSTGTVRTTNFPIDLQLVSNRPQNAQPGHFAYDRLRGVSTTDTAEGTYLNTTYLGGENTNIALTRAFNNTGFTDAAYLSGYSAVWWNFRRAPGFFDVVAFGPGNSTTMTVNHNLGVLPELVIIKSRSSGGQWLIQNGSTNYGFFNASAFSAGSIFTTLTNTAFSSTVDGNTYIAYLFATLAGISKVGSYTGTGTTLSIDCGFTAGARFVLIKRTDSTGDWYVWDTARGIISGDDPYLLLNTTAAEVTNTDYIDPLSSGFQITSTAPAAINASGGSFIFLAIA
jgi:hypothetical protein